MKSERYLLSAHADREVGPPWDQEIQRRIEADPEWAREWQTHQRVKSALAGLKDPAELEASQKQVRERLEAFIQIKQNPIRHETSRLHFVRLLTTAAVFGLIVGGVGYWMGSRSAAASTSTVAEVHVKLPANYTPPLNGDSELIKMTSFEGSSR
jgi:ferric-dicitrate binding protein FerR (iron transport regulator)